MGAAAEEAAQQVRRSARRGQGRPLPKSQDADSKATRRALGTGRPLGDLSTLEGSLGGLGKAGDYNTVKIPTTSFGVRPFSIA
jgi:hypothetical protein